MINFIKFLEDGNVARLGVSDWLIFTVQSGLKHLAMPKLLGTTTQGGFLLILGNTCLRGWTLKRLVPSLPICFPANDGKSWIATNTTIIQYNILKFDTKFEVHLTSLH